MKSFLTWAAYLQPQEQSLHLQIGFVAWVFYKGLLQRPGAVDQPLVLQQQGPTHGPDYEPSPERWP